MKGRSARCFRLHVALSPPYVADHEDVHAVLLRQPCEARVGSGALHLFGFEPMQKVLQAHMGHSLRALPASIREQKTRRTGYDMPADS